VAGWLQDLTRVFQDMGGELDKAGNLPISFRNGLTESIGQEADFDLIHPVGDGTDFLFIRGDSAYIVRFDPSKRKTQVTFLGKLKGGRYTERIQVEEKSLQIEMQYEHRALGSDKVLHWSFTKPTTPVAHWSTETERTVARGRRLRETLRRWSGTTGLADSLS